MGGWDFETYAEIYGHVSDLQGDKGQIKVQGLQDCIN